MVSAFVAPQRFMSQMGLFLSTFRLPGRASAAERVFRVCALAVLILAGVGASGAIAAEDDAAPLVASSVHVEDAPGTSRLVFDISAPVQATAFVMSDPNRVIVDLPQVNFDIDPRSGAPVAKPATARGRKAVTLAGLISSYRFGLFAPGKSRIVIDLSHTAKIVSVQSLQRREGHYLLTISLTETDAASFRSAAAAAVAASSEPVARLVQPEAAVPDDPTGLRPLIVLDPGHGGIDSGAQGLSGAIEKDIVFDFSRTLKALLDATGRYRVVMTRN
ncbi:MAG: N-acetylmuramoyl-L-alanine amidase, partial [Hyphomicrobiales bacterium]|nr:N-acetylmuramoyl-L-alanine amidase [Hyphomicrobiales bacterium]